MKKRVKNLAQMILALVLCVAMLVPGATSFCATETEVVYDSKEALFSAMRKALLPREKVNLLFQITESVRDEIGYYDEFYHQYFLKTDRGVIFDFYGDQMSIPANEGDYLYQSMVGFSSMGNLSGTNGTYVNLEAGSFMTTAAQEATFESALKGLFASGGALANTKSMSKAEAVIACMNYINANVKGISSWKGEDHSAYGALCKGQATCQGKALLLYRMLRELGIANRILMGTDAAAHTYNIVLIDGKYYYCDPSTTNVILKGSNSFSPSALQEHYQTAEFKAGVLSKISTSDYPLPSSSSGGSTSGGGSSSGGGSTAGGGSSSGGGSSTGGSTGGTQGGASQAPSGQGHTHTAGDWVVEKEATLEEVGSQSKKCTSCGQVLETQEIPKLVEYKVLDGADSVFYTLDAKTTEFTLRAGGEMEKFVSVEVDDKVVDSKYYTVTSGSTIITFTKEFMDTLTAGEHVVTFNFTDGIATANIKVDKTSEPEDESVDATESVEDESTEVEKDSNSGTANKDAADKGGISPVVWVVLILVVAAGAVGGVIWYKKRKGDM